MRTINVALIIFIMVLAFLGIYLIILSAYSFQQEKRIPVVTNIDTTSDIENACSNMSLIDTSLCLNKNIKTFFYYNISNIGKRLSFSQLKEEGGVCDHWVETYQGIADKLGFETQNIEIFPEELDVGHTFLIVFDETGYCLLDQKVTPFCVTMPNGSEEDS